VASGNYTYLQLEWKRFFPIILPMSKPEQAEYTMRLSAQDRSFLIEALNKLLEIEAESLQVPGVPLTMLQWNCDARPNRF
jgi:hypothetical protein